MVEFSRIACMIIGQYLVPGRSSPAARVFSLSPRGLGSMIANSFGSVEDRQLDSNQRAKA